LSRDNEVWPGQGSDLVAMPTDFNMSLPETKTTAADYFQKCVAKGFAGSDDIPVRLRS